MIFAGDLAPILCKENFELETTEINYLETYFKTKMTVQTIFLIKDKMGILQVSQWNLDENRLVSIQNPQNWEEKYGKDFFPTKAVGLNINPLNTLRLKFKVGE